MKKWIILGVIAVIVVLLIVGPPKKDPTEGFVDIQWSTSELVSRLPVPESTFGKVAYEMESAFCVDLGEVSSKQYDAYIQKCEQAGFTVDYSKSSTSFSAKDRHGYSLYITYDAENEIMGILLSAPNEKSDVETTTTKKKETTTTTEVKVEESDGLSKEFKEAMDAYEAFMDDYVRFMKKYQANPTDLELLSDYAEFVSDYADYCDEFAEWEDEDLNDAELKYYLEVQSRVSKKLLEVAG